MESCTPCGKAFYNLKSWQGHLSSRTHARRVGDAEGDEVAEELTKLTLDSALVDDGSEEEEAGHLPLNPYEEEKIDAAAGAFISSECLFCNFDSSSLEQNLEHMRKMHGLFIPDQEYLIDMETFIGYLFTVISEFYECLYCGSTKTTAEAVQSHMKDRGHCSLNFDRESELELFYDFSEADVILGMESGEGSQAMRYTSPSVRSKVEIDNELHLPSGKTLGHRTQARSFRQQTRPQPSSTEECSQKAVTAGPSSDPGMTTDPRTGREVATRAGGGMIGVPMQQQRALRTVEKMMLKAEVRARSRFERVVEKSGNRQKHFKVKLPLSDIW